MEQRKGARAVALLHLSGSPRQIGRTHGSAARAAEALECIRFFGTFLDLVFRFRVPGSLSRLARGIARRGIAEAVERPFIEKIPVRYRETLEGLAEGSGLPADLVLRAYVMPDVYAYLLAKRFTWGRPAQLAGAGWGCTTAVAFSNARAREGLLHARNLDFPGGTRWSDFPAVVEYAPEGGQKYLSVTSLGVETAGVTSMNEAGLTLAINMNYSRRVTTEGIPILSIGHEVIRRAGTIDEAIAIVRDYPKGAGWTFTLTSHRERKAAVVECDAKQFGVRWMADEPLVCTNHFLLSDVASQEYWISPGRKLDTEARYARCRDLLSKPTPIDPLRMAEILSDSCDRTGERESGFGGTVAQVHTVSSVVFEPAERRFHLACGSPPVSKEPFHAHRCFGSPFRLGLTRPADAEDAAARGRRAYHDAYETYFPGGDLLEVERHLREASDAAPEEGLYLLMLSVVQGMRGDFEAAEHTIRRGRALPEAGYPAARTAFTHARILDAGRKRSEAIEVYRTLATDPAFGEQARKGIRRPFARREFQRLILDFTVGDAIDGG
ncbi:MAG: C45 family peptidase [Pseudomonadota bacterium]